MRSKEEQLIRSIEIIDKQAEELVSVYGWEEKKVFNLANDLKRHARKEVEYYHDEEDVSGCWKLVSWKSNLRTHLAHNFKELELVDEDKAYQLRSLTYRLTDTFDFIENIEIDKLDLIAEYRDGKGAFGVKTINEKYMIWDLIEIQQSVESKGLFEVAKKIYSKLLEKNKEITGA